jgi:uncharacterized protein (TIGR00369 family)
LETGYRPIVPFDITTEPVRGIFGDPSFVATPGFESMRRVLRGEFARPPIHHLLGLTPAEAGLGKATFTLPVTRWLEDSFGIIHAGAYPMVADAALSMALQSGMPAGRAVTTTQLMMSYVRPATRETTHINARAQSIHIGREVGIAECRIEDQLGRVLGYGSTRCLFRDMPFDPDAQPVPAPAPIEDPPDPYLRPVPDSLYVDYQDVADLKPLEFTRAIISSDLPNGARYLITGMTPTHTDEGSFGGTAIKSPWLSAGTPFMYGGFLAWVCDGLLGGAVWASLDKGEAFATLDMEVRFLRPVPLDGGLLFGEARVVHGGRRIRVGEVTIGDEQGKTVAMATGSAMVIPGGIAALFGGRPPDEIVTG